MLALLFVVCKASDLRTESLKSQGVTAEHEARGRSILREALDSMHYDIWAKQPVYEIVGSDRWNKQMGLQISPWPGDNGAKLKLTYATNSFDSKAEWLDGSQKGQVIGVQSWQLYTLNGNGQAERMKANRRLSFILPTMHYFNEILPRLANAPVVAFAGAVQEAGQTFDLVFCTWDNPQPNQHDQYLLYINRQNRRLERVQYTIRDNYMWTPANFYGTAVYSDYRQVDSVWIPFRLEVFPFGQIHKKVVHRFQIEEFRFGTQPLPTLYPFENLPKMGDSKH